MCQAYIFLTCFFSLCINFSREEIHSIACQRDITHGTQLVHKEADTVEVLLFCIALNLQEFQWQFIGILQFSCIFSAFILFYFLSLPLQAGTSKKDLSFDDQDSEKRSAPMSSESTVMETQLRKESSLAELRYRLCQDQDLLSYLLLLVDVSNVALFGFAHCLFCSLNI